ncbi:NAD(P)-binding protein [Mycena galericulata]|nr:NAD(P)-binding protein [Mycena galericulata]
MSSTPRITKALVLQKSPGAFPSEQPIPALKSGEVLVKMSAVAFNHRELWIRKGLYPRIAVGSTCGADGAGEHGEMRKVIAAADTADPLLKQRVFLTPMRGWESDPNGPESNFGILGSSSFPPLGTFAEYVVVRREEVIPTPPHLTNEQIAAWPLAGLTAWRSLIMSSYINVLIPGIGGGVTLMALQLCVALGASVYLGAKGGASYKDEDWPAQIGALLKQNAGGGVRPVLDAVIDGGGDDIMRKTSLYLKSGGRVVCYGMTAGPEITMTLREVMRGQQLLGASDSSSSLD